MSFTVVKKVSSFYSRFNRIGVEGKADRFSHHFLVLPKLMWQQPTTLLLNFARNKYA